MVQDVCGVKTKSSAVADFRCCVVEKFSQVLTSNNGVPLKFGLGVTVR